MGTPDFAVPALRAVARSCDVVAVVTQPDRPRGRGLKLAPSAVACAAEELGLPVLKPERPNAPETVDSLRALSPDLFAVVAFGAILRPALLGLPRLGAINLHGSLLPDYRGASPVQRALWEGRAGTGVTTLWMDEGIDTGDCILQRWLPILSEDDAGSLAQRLAEAGAPLLAESLALASNGRAPRHPQPPDAGSYAARLAKSDGRVEWELDVEAVWNRQRAVTPWPGAATAHQGRRLILAKTRPFHRLRSREAPGTVLEVTDHGVLVACAPGALEILRAKPGGRTEMDAAEWARGVRIRGGEVLETQKEAAT